MAKWVHKNGAWVLVNPSTTDRSEPIIRGVPLDGKAPAISIKHGAWKSDKYRKYDKPTEADIKKLEKEDDDRRKKELDIEPTVMEAKRELQSGKLRVDEECLKESDKRIVPFGSVTDERGITHVVPKYKLPASEQAKQFDIKSISPDVSPEQLNDGKRGEGPKLSIEEWKAIFLAELEEKKKKEGTVSVTMGRTMMGNGGPNPGDQIKRMMNYAVNANREDLRGKTFGF